MTLRDAILSATSLSSGDDEEESIIYAQDAEDLWEANTLCVLLKSEETGGKVVLEKNGRQLHYFLGISLMLEVIEGWQEIGRSNDATEDDIAHVVIYYARYDAWPQPSHAE